jgi:hypothetical protein
VAGEGALFSSLHLPGPHPNSVPAPKLTIPVLRDMKVNVSCIISWLSTEHVVMHTDCALLSSPIYAVKILYNRNIATTGVMILVMVSTNLYSKNYNC